MKKLKLDIEDFVVYTLSFIFSAIGLLVITFLGIIPLCELLNYNKVSATVIEVRTFANDSNSNLLAVVTYEYEVNGVIYKKESSNSQSASISPLVGDKITIYCLKTNPEITKDNFSINIILLVFGAVFAFFGIGGFICKIKDKF